MGEYHNMRDGCTTAGGPSRTSAPIKNEHEVRRFYLKQKLGINELWKKAKRHAKEISASEAEPALLDFGEESGLYYATVVDAAGNKYRYYCERK